MGEAAFLDDHEEEQAIDEAKEVGVEVRGELGTSDQLAESVVGGVIEQAVGKV